MKSQPCGSVTASGSGSTTAWLALAWFQIFFNLAGRRLQSSAITYIKNNDATAYVEPSVQTYRSGVEALLNSRCSTWLASNGVGGATACEGARTKWYADSTNGCSRGRLELVDTTIYEPLGTYLGRFAPPTPPPVASPSPPPPSPPGPPPPHPPPTPPRFASHDGALAFAAKIQRDFCDSVYIVSAETRCNALAKEMHVQFQLDSTWHPPALPPIAPENSGIPPPPPPRPPSPRPPLIEDRIIRRVSVYAATLSTYFLPQIAPSPPPYGYAQYASERRGLQSELGVTVDAAQLATALLRYASMGSTPTKWAACTESLMAAGAPLPCRTAGNPLRCLDGATHCGTAEENTFEPFVELDFHEYVPDYNGRMYLFLVHFRLPAEEEYARLMFHPLELYGGDVVENRGWRLSVYDDHHNDLPVQCQDWNYGASATEYIDGLVDLHHLCLTPTATNEEYEVLSRARFVRITLLGNYRQIWFDDINVYFRAIIDVELSTNETYTISASLSPPPPTARIPEPPAAPDPPATPTANCVFYINEAKADFEQYVVVREPCGLTKERCCALSYEHNRLKNHASAFVDSFVLSATGCCVLTRLGGGSSLAIVPAVDSTGAKIGWEAYQMGVAGMGVLAVV